MVFHPYWFRIPAAVLCTLPVQAQTAPPAAPETDLAERLFRSGERAYAAKSYKEALDTWGQLLQSSPKSPFAPQVLLQMARHQVDVAGKPEAAMPYLDRLKADYIKFPEAAEGLLLRGLLLARLARRPGELKDATAEFHRVIDLFPDAPAVPRARLELGRAWRDQGQWRRAHQQFVQAFLARPDAPVAATAMLESAEVLDLMGDLTGCLRMLQQLRTLAPTSPEAQEAEWRLVVRVKHRLRRPPLRNDGAWPGGRVKWLKTPTLLALAPDGDLLIYQNDLDQAFRLRQGELAPAGPAAPGGRALLVAPGGAAWVLGRAGLIREDAAAPLALGGLNAISGATLDRWGALWVADAKTPALTIFGADGNQRTLASPTANAMAPLPSGGAIIAADTDRKLLYLDAEGQPILVVPYGQGLPEAFRTVVALAADGAGQVAALVDGGDYGEGVVILGPDGTVLRHATFKALGVGGRITALALDHTGGLLLCDRRNDLLIRLN